MRPLRLLAGVVAALLLASCSSSPKPSPLTITEVVTTSPAPAPSVPAPPPDPNPEQPGPGSSFDQVAAWVENAPEADPGGYGSATQTWQTPPSTTALGTGAAFSSPSGKITCVYAAEYAPGLTCQVALEHPLPRPSDGFGNWKGGWTDYTGDSVNLGSFHGDPGAFINGYGAELPYGRKISVGAGPDAYVCRMEQAGLTCVAKAKGSGVLLNDQGVTPYGCLKPAKPVYATSTTYACG